MDNLKMIEFQTLRNMTWGYEFNENLWMIDEYDAKAIVNEEVNNKLFTVYRMTEDFDGIEVSKLAGYAILANTPIKANEVKKMSNIVISPDAWGLGDTWYLSEIVIAPEFRETGVFSELMSDVLTHAESDPKITDIYLNAMTDKMQSIMKKKRKRYNASTVTTTDGGVLWKIHVIDEDILNKKLKVKNAKVTSMKIIMWALMTLEAFILAKFVPEIDIMIYVIIQMIAFAIVVYICAIIEE